MKLVSKRVDYALAALIDLAGSPDKQPMHGSDIAKRNDIPNAYLGQILIELKKGGYLDSVRGTNGGYILAKDPGEISVLDVVETLDGGITVLDGPARSRALDVFAKEIEGEIKRVLGISISALMAREPPINFVI